MSVTWFTSDEHYDHSNIIEYCKRPFSDVNDMREALIRRHNQVVKKGDTVWHLGDFAMKTRTVAEVLPRLNGEHHLLCGNHDECVNKKTGQLNLPKVTEYLRHGFRSVRVGEPFSPVRLYEDGSVGVALGGMPVARVSHMPFKEVVDARYPRWRPDMEGLPLVHGHTHERWKTRGRMVCVCVEQWTYYPVDSRIIVDIVRGL